jgi:hypothetical protein
MEIRRVKTEAAVFHPVIAHKISLPALFLPIYISSYSQTTVTRCSVPASLHISLFCFTTVDYIGHAVAQLKHCATNRNVAGSVPDVVTGIFHWHNPSGRTMVLGSTQSLTEMSTRNIFWGKGDRCVGLTTLPLSCADCLKIWDPQLPRTPRACQGL